MAGARANADWIVLSEIEGEADVSSTRVQDAMKAKGLTKNQIRSKRLRFRCSHATRFKCKFTGRASTVAANGVLGPRVRLETKGMHTGHDPEREPPTQRLTTEAEGQCHNSQYHHV